MSFGLVLFVGFVASLSTCTASVGGLVVALSAHQTHGTLFERLRPHLLFHAGRIGGFAFLGALIGVLGSVLSLSSEANGVFTLLVAFLMVVLGAGLLGLLPAVVGTHSDRFTARLEHLAAQKNAAVPFVLGILTFFLPCGFTQSIQLYALSTGNPAEAALIMAVFAIGTAPVLFAFALAMGLTKGSTRRVATQVAGALVMALGFLHVSSGARLLGFVPVHAATPADLAPIVEGAQFLQMEVDRGEYAPRQFTVLEDAPVRWEIFGGKHMGCGSNLVIPTLDIQVFLEPGENVIEFTPQEPGAYVFTCSAGVYDGVLTVITKT